MVETLLLKKGRFLNFTLTFIASFFLVTTSWGQTVTTDKDDYAPGEYVIITGTDWEPGERVDFTFVETPKPETCVNSHDNFAIADASGKIYYDGFLIKINHLGVHFVLTATGQSSGRIAVTEFTDANVKFSTMGLPKNVDVTVQYQGTRPGPTPVNTSVTFSTGGGGNGASGNIALIGNLSFQFPSTITVVGTVYTLVSTTPTSPTTVPENGSFGIEATYIVGKGASTISVNAAGPFTYNTNPQGPDQVTKSGSTGAVTFSYVGVSGTIYSASTSKPTNAGNYQVTATLASDANYNGAVSAPLAFSIVKATPTATLAVSNSPQTYTGSGQSATVSISASSVPGTVTNILTGGSATQTNANTYAVTANFVPNDAVNYNSLTALAAGNFVIGKAESTIITTGTTSFTYTGSAQGPGTSTVTGSTGEVTYSYTGTNNGSVAYGPSATKPTLAGSYSVVATVAADDNYNAKSSEAYDFAIDKANQSITWATPSNIVYGTLLSATQLNATVAVPGSEAHGAITYDPAVDTELAAGDHTLTVNVAGSANYNAASATVELTVEKANQSITWATPSNIVYGTLLSATQLNATVAVPGSEAHGAITYDPAVDTELAAGDHTLTVNVAGSANYNAASATVELTVEKANQSIAWATPSNIVYGTLLSATQLNATVAVPGSEAHGAITYDPAVDTELAAGDHTLTVNVAGSANYNSASATVELTVEKANQSITWATPSNIVYGTLLSATQLNATVAVPGSEAHGAITYDPAVDTELAAGDHTLTVNVAGSANYNSASATVELTVEKANQSITWATPSNIVYGTLLSATQLNATVAVPGSEAHGAITYDPAAGTELAAGDHTLTVNVAGSDNYNAASATVELTVDKANQSITWATPSNIVYGTLLSATQLNATVAVPGSEAHGAITYDPAAGTELAAGDHTLTVNVAGSDNYNAASATVELTVDKANQSITWATPSNIVYGTLLSATQLNATVAVPGSEAHGAITYDPAAGTELAAGDHTLTVNVAGSDNYNAASATVELTVDKANQSITWATPSNIVYGTLLSATQLNATVAVPGSEAHGAITYDPAAGTELAAGDHTLTVNVAGSDNYNAASATVELTVDKANQSITWATPSNIVYGTLLSATQLNATVAVPGSEAHGAITYDPAAGTELAAGDHTLTVNVAGSDNYNAASATVELTVDKANQSITWATPSNIVYGTLLSATQLNATVAVPGSEAHGAITYDPAAGTELAAGDHTLTVNVAGSDNYNAASATVELTVDKANQSITWATPSNIVYGTLLSATQLNATVAVPGSEAHGAITYDPAAGTELAAGDHTLTVNVASSDNYNAASATVELTVDKANQSITWATPSNIVYGTLLSATQLNATVAVPGSEAHGAITYDPAAGTELAAGDHTLTVNVAGSDNYNAASATVELTVDKANQSITWATPSNIVYGTLLSATQLNATVAVPGSEAHGAITYDPAAGTELAAGDHTLTVNVAGSDNYNAASATVELTVDKANQSITWATPSNIVYGTLLSATQLNATVAVPGSEAHGAITYDPAAGTELAAGDHTLTVNVAGSDNYNAASATVELTVDKANQSITWATPSNIVYGTLLSATQLNATVAVPGSEAHGAITYDPAAGTELAAGDHTLTVNVAGSDNYNAASATVELTVDKANQSITWATPSNIVYGTLLSATQLNATVAVPGSEAHGAITYDPAAGTELAAGDHTLTVNVAGSDNYNAASATVELTVDKANQTITWADPANIVYGTLLSATQLNATVAVPGSEAPGAITYDPIDGTELAAGDHTLTVNVAGSDNYNAASATVELTVEKANQSITWATPSNIVYGTLLSATQLNATVAVPGSEAPGAITYDPIDGTELAAGDHTLTVNVAGSDNYNAASATVELTVDKANQSITWATPSNIVYGTLLSATQLNATVAVPGSEAHGAITYDPAAGTELAAGDHTLTVNVAGSDNYNAASATVELTVEKANQSITWATPSNIVYGTLLSATQLNATVAVPGSEAPGAITYTPAAGTKLDAGNDQALNVDVVGSDNYNSATVTVYIDVTKAVLNVTSLDKSKFCGQENPVLGVSYNGFVSGENENVLDTRPTASTTADGTSTGSSYVITASGGVDNNYSFTYVNGTLTVTSVTIDASSSSNPVQLGTAATLSAKVTPAVAGVSVTFTLSEYNTTNAGTFAQSYTATTGTNGIATVSVANLPSDVYKVTAIAGGGCSSSDAYLPVYDPNGGFVTGGGWIYSKAGNMQEEQAQAEGKANFGFNAKYKTGKNNMTEVDGNTNFQFQAGDLHLKSLSHDNMSLVISGAKATYRGVGTVNGKGNHKFLLIAIDGDVSGGGGVDKFRIKIWKDNSSAILYDNRWLQDENSNDATILGGGSIVIHKPKAGGKTAETTQTLTFEKGTSELTQQPVQIDILGNLAVAPNPVRTDAKVRFSLIEDAGVTVRLFDFNGREIYNLYSGNAKANEVYEVGFQRNNMMSGIYIVRLTTDRGQSYTKNVIVE